MELPQSHKDYLMKNFKLSGGHLDFKMCIGQIQLENGEWTTPQVDLKSIFEDNKSVKSLKS